MAGDLDGWPRATEGGRRERCSRIALLRILGRPLGERHHARHRLDGSGRTPVAGHGGTSAQLDGADSGSLHAGRSIQHTGDSHGERPEVLYEAVDVRAREPLLDEGAGVSRDALHPVGSARVSRLADEAVRDPGRPVSPEEFRPAPRRSSESHAMLTPRSRHRGVPDAILPEESGLNGSEEAERMSDETVFRQAGRHGTSDWYSDSGVIGQALVEVARLYAVPPVSVAALLVAGVGLGAVGDALPRAPRPGGGDPVPWVAAGAPAPPGADPPAALALRRQRRASPAV